MNKPRFLPDINVLLAITNDDHEFYQLTTEWMKKRGDSEFLLCPLTETGFLRKSCQVFDKNLRESILLLRELMKAPGFGYTLLPDSWLNLSAPYLWQLQGHKQITDAYLMGVAIQENAVLVTLDTRIESWASPKYDRHLLSLLESRRRN